MVTTSPPECAWEPLRLEHGPRHAHHHLVTTLYDPVLLGRVLSCLCTPCSAQYVPNLRELNS